jgi:antitoxin component of RelBE/YafQ-DinJ toxin-antitoxin module
MLIQKEKDKSKNKTMKRPVISLRIDPEVLATFKAICVEAGDIDRSKAIERILHYLVKPTSIETTKAIIQEDPSEYN